MLAHHCAATVHHCTATVHHCTATTVLPPCLSCVHLRTCCTHTACMLKVVRAWEQASDTNGHPSGMVLRFNITNTHHAPLELSALGFAMPAAGMQHGIEQASA